MRQHEVCECAVKDGVSIKKTLTVFYWLKNSQFIQKTDKNYCAPFQITVKGQMFCQILEMKENLPTR
jgi:hypothetical protein